MGELLDLLVDLDHHAIRATGELRWAPATAVLALMSAWWVKGPVLVALGWCADVRCGRRYPLVALAATVSFFVASGLNAALKPLVDRNRPPEAVGLDALVGVPGSASFPSGHAMTAFATAGAVAVLAPRLRWPMVGLAAVIAFSRVYLGVHFWLDIVAGAALGMAVGLVVSAAFRRSVERPRARRQAAAVPGDGVAGRARPGATPSRARAAGTSRAARMTATVKSPTSQPSAAPTTTSSGK
jgi:membrane-associated phospholipid phosphatase